METLNACYVYAVRNRDDGGLVGFAHFGFWCNGNVCLCVVAKNEASRFTLEACLVRETSAFIYDNIQGGWIEYGWGVDYVIGEDGEGEGLYQEDVEEIEFQRVYVPEYDHNQLSFWE